MTPRDKSLILMYRDQLQMSWESIGTRLNLDPFICKTYYQRQSNTKDFITQPTEKQMQLGGVIRSTVVNASKMFKDRSLAEFGALVRSKMDLPVSDEMLIRIHRDRM